MISPEMLRCHQFFDFVPPAQLREVALITEEVAVNTDGLLFEIGTSAESLYLLRNGAIELR
jgi:hypothetical protein